MYYIQATVVQKYWPITQIIPNIKSKEFIKYYLSELFFCPVTRPFASYEFRLFRPYHAYMIVRAGVQQHIYHTTSIKATTNANEIFIERTKREVPFLARS